MAILETVVDGLRKAEKELLAELAGVRAAITSLAFGKTSSRRARPQGSKNVPAARKVKGRRRGTLSAKGRKAISEAQKTRWAKIKAAKRGGRNKGQDVGNG